MASFRLDMAKLDKLAEDLGKLKRPQKSIKGLPIAQRKGYLQKLGSNNKWYKRWFVLRDSFLLSYNFSKSNHTVEPTKCIHLAKGRVERLSPTDKSCGKKEFCFRVTTRDKDMFIFHCENEKERRVWCEGIEIARNISHRNMIKLAVENQVLVEEKGLADVVREHSASALAIFANTEYIRRTPLTGGCEGWLMSPGFCCEYNGNKKLLKRWYFQLIDSHILMFANGDALKKPRGAMFLVGCVVDMMLTQTDMCAFKVRSEETPDYVELVAENEKERSKWTQALQVGSNVTYGQFKMLLQEHDILKKVPAGVMEVPDPTPPDDQAVDEAAAAAALETDLLQLEDDLKAVSMEQAAMTAHMDTAQVEDVQGQELDPATHQAYDEEGNPLLRNPDGKLVNKDGAEVGHKTNRYTLTGEQLDPFNRMLPQGAAPMFTADGSPIGVGPDGKHYLPDGTEINADAPHFDADGNLLDQTVVDASAAIASTVGVAIKARQRIKGEAGEEVDVLGRTFRAANEDGQLVNADGETVDPTTARRVVNDKGEVVTGESKKIDSSHGTLHIKLDGPEGIVVIGSVEINEFTTLTDVRRQVSSDVEAAGVQQFVFKINSVPVTRAEELDKRAMGCLPEVFIRGLVLAAPKSAAFSKKLSKFTVNDEEKKKERNDFEDMMAKVRGGNFLKKVNPLDVDM